MQDDALTLAVRAARMSDDELSAVLAAARDLRNPTDEEVAAADEARLRRTARSAVRRAA